MLNHKIIKWAIAAALALTGCQIRQLTNNRKDTRRNAVENPGGMNEVVDGSGTPTNGGQVAGGLKKERPAICAELDKPCAGEASATFCNLKAVPGFDFNETSRIHAYGKSSCEARKAVLAAACNGGIDIKSLDTITCEADKSEGKCPADFGMCITLYDPHKCVARKLGEQTLSGDSLVAGWGGNSCVARFEMRKFACSRNLNPERLGDISCDRMTAFQNDCPPVNSRCEATDKARTSCEVTPAGGARLASEADGACLARFKLEWQMCLAGQSPVSLASQVKCSAL